MIQGGFMNFRKQNVIMASLLVLLLICGTGPVYSQNVDATKGEAFLKQMSEKLAASKSFSFSTTELQDKIGADGKKAQLKFSRDALVRRPDGVWTHFQGERDWKLWYDGKFLTIVSDKDKIFVQRATPKTIDETMDFIAERFDMDLPMSDILYSSPYEAFMAGGSKGGFVGVEQIEGASCSHLSYQNKAVAWHLWINEKDSLPCKLQIQYKETEGQPVSEITFRNWNLAANVKENAFAFNIPAGYERIPILERVRLKEVDEPQTQTKPNDK
jgi:hypothetical protein